jgi:anti-anti-sigma factor
MELALTRETADSGAVRLRLVGAIDLSTKPSVLDAGMQALEESSGLVLNLAGVSFMDSAGIGTLVELSREAEDREKSFAIEEPSHRVARVLSVTGLQDAWS